MNLGAIADRLGDALDARLTKLNTPLVGYGGVGLVVAAAGVPHVAPHVAAFLAAHDFGHIEDALDNAERAGHAVAGAVGAMAALLGRWKRFSDGHAHSAVATVVSAAASREDTAAAAPDAPANFRRAISTALRDREAPVFVAPTNAVAADVPRPQPRIAAASPHDAGSTGGRSPMGLSIIQDFGIIEAVAGDVVAFAGGKTVSQTVDGYTASVVLLPSGPVAPFQVLSGSFLSILELVFADAAAFAAGSPVSIAEKIGNTWYGVSLSKSAAAAPVVG